MSVTVSLYNHTTAKFADGTFLASNTYKINLYSVFVHDATATTKAGAESGATQLTSANGYTQNDKTTACTVSTVTTNDAKWDLADVTWSATPGNIGPARYALVYNDSVTDDPPVFSIDFGEDKTANGGTDFKITWHTDGVLTFTYT